MRHILGRAQRGARQAGYFCPTPEHVKSGWCTSSVRLIPTVRKPGTMPSLQSLYEGVLPWFPLFFLPIGTDCPGVAVPHAPVGMAQRPHFVPNDTGAPTPTAQA